MTNTVDILQDIFAAVILLTAFANSVGMVNPISQMLVQSQIYTTATHYQVLDTYNDIGLNYMSKTPIPAGYELVIHSGSSGYAGLRAVGSPASDEKVIGNYRGTKSGTVQGPGWMILKSTTEGYEVIDYHAADGASTLISEAHNQMPFESQLVGLGKALSDVTSQLYDI
ncbi:hypothetical protein Metho_2501 (plasmid) [Methanomethylovorans hollandica DSM 15978]|jgi:hypothetical protein|uniref:Uncharacterized protein n=1 Tax=Methanomethylovorans hollandica (strain DSM 15978 / NBRC 107637 / DMS1) TaxID=867904 RepID=L0KZV5_METHD|nr:hypothetical protein [Methanomethylovorans hollandica]AGB50641.1 hypothetical protein Metho_2501 [Methanomethylovorans hollandica DSM 15978]